MCASRKIHRPGLHIDPSLQKSCSILFLPSIHHDQSWHQILIFQKSLLYPKFDFFFSSYQIASRKKLNAFLIEINSLRSLTLFSQEKKKKRTVFSIPPHKFFIKKKGKHSNLFCAFQKKIRRLNSYIFFRNYELDVKSSNITLNSCVYYTRFFYLMKLGFRILNS